MKKITVNGIAYLGKVKEENGEVILTNAMSTKRVDKNSIQMYLKRKNMDDLETITFSGQGTSVSVSKLDDEQKMTFDICKRAMKLARKRGEEGVVNAVFEELLGKL